MEVSHMPRPKGSKNKPKTVKATVDFAAQIAEKQSAKEAPAVDHCQYRCIESWPENQKSRAEINRQGNRQNRGQKVKAETKAAESAKKAEAEDVLKKLLASGMTADEILAKLK